MFLLKNYWKHAAASFWVNLVLFWFLFFILYMQIIDINNDYYNNFCSSAICSSFSNKHCNLRLKLNNSCTCFVCVKLRKNSPNLTNFPKHAEFSEKFNWFFPPFAYLILIDLICVIFTEGLSFHTFSLTIYLISPFYFFFTWILGFSLQYKNKVYQNQFID